MSAAFEKATRVVAELRPADVWQLLANSNKHYINVGESHHGNMHIKRELARGLPILGAKDYRHLGVEQELRYHTPAINAFQDADKRQRRTGSDLRLLQRHYRQWVSPYVLDVGDNRHEDMDAETGVIVAARESKVRVHCLNDMIEFDEYLQQINEPRATRFAKLMEHAMLYDDMPKGTTQEENSRLTELCVNYDAFNRTQDVARVQRLLAGTGAEKAIIYFGSDHFRYSKTQGIEKHLPGSSASVMIGEYDLMMDNLAYNFRRHRSSLPDFLITTDSEQGIALPPARRSGLLP